MQDILVKSFFVWTMIKKIATVFLYGIVIVGFIAIAGFMALVRFLGSSDLALTVVLLCVAAPIVASGVKAYRWARAQQQLERDRGIEDIQPVWRIMFGGAKTEKRKQLLLRDWQKACAANTLKPTPRLLNLQRTREGDYKAIISSKSGLSVDKVGEKRDQIARVVGCHEMTFSEIDDGRAVVEFFWTKPLEREVTPQDLAPAPKGQVAVGKCRSGTAFLPVINPKTGESTVTPILIGATTGAGKSGAVHAMIAGYIAAGIPLRLWIYDPKGKEFATYGRYVGASVNPRFEVAAYSGEEGGDVALLKRMEAEMVARMAEQEGRASVVTVESPINLFICDEWFELTKSVVESKSSLLRRVMYIGRGFGFSAVALVQDPTIEAMGGLRRLFDRRIGLRTQAIESTTAIFGTPWKAKAAPCHEIRRHGTAGTFYMDDDRDIIKGRFAFYHDDDLELLAQGLLPVGAVQGGDRRCHLYTYRGWDKEQNRVGIVYIGESFDVEKRWTEHQDEARRNPHGDTAVWVEKVLRYRQFEQQPVPWRHSDPYPSKKAALEAEERAIKAAADSGEPISNKVHNPRFARRFKVAA